MWFCLLISGFVYRTCITEFSELYEVLYQDDEMLPNPDLSSFMSVVRLAPVSIWIHMNQRNSSSSTAAGGGDASSSTTQSNAGQQTSSLNRTASGQAKSIVLPEILRDNYALLQDCLTNQHFQDFRLSVWK